MKRGRHGKKARYRDVVTIQRDDSAAGVEVADWKLFAGDVPCLVSDVNGQSTYRGMQLLETVSTVVEMHYLAGLSPDMQVVYGDRTLQIKFVKEWKNGNARMKHWLFCEELAA